MGLLSSPEFWGAIAVALLGYLVALARTALNQQQALLAERLKDSIMTEVAGMLRENDRKARLALCEIRELRELRRKDNLELAKILSALPGGPIVTNLYGFDKHPYTNNCDLED